jgi:CDP-diglyceride synthetase
VWYILGVNCVLALLPQDVATVAILMYVLPPLPSLFDTLRTLPDAVIPLFALFTILYSYDVRYYSLSWADTAASTFGRLYGPATRKLPARLPLLGLPLAPRKSVAGFAAATITGALIAVGFWGFVAPLREGGAHLSWTWEGGVRNPDTGASLGGGGALGLLALSVFAGLVSGVAEALGKWFPIFFFLAGRAYCSYRPGLARRQPNAPNHLWCLPLWIPQTRRRGLLVVQLMMATMNQSSWLSIIVMNHCSSLDL